MTEQTSETTDVIDEDKLYAEMIHPTIERLLREGICKPETVSRALVRGAMNVSVNGIGTRDGFIYLRLLLDEMEARCVAKPDGVRVS